MVQIILLKPYSIWTQQISSEARQGNFITKFFYENGMWKEFKDAPFGIGLADMNYLIESKKAIAIDKTKI